MFHIIASKMNFRVSRESLKFSTKAECCVQGISRYLGFYHQVKPVGAETRPAGIPGIANERVPSSALTKPPGQGNF